jgi:hypothetical protein
MALSGQADTHNPQASHAPAFGVNACFQPCAIPLSLPFRESPPRSDFGSTPITKTPLGQTDTQSDFPSQRLRSISGAIVPGGCLQVGLADLFMTSQANHG